MQALTAIPDRNRQRNRPKDPYPTKRASASTGQRPRRAFTPLIDAKAASQLLGVPYTWLLAQARANRIPHQRLGHYVRFDPDDLQTWLKETKSEPSPGRRRAI